MRAFATTGSPSPSRTSSWWQYAIDVLLFSYHQTMLFVAIDGASWWLLPLAGAFIVLPLIGGAPVYLLLSLGRHSLDGWLGRSGWPPHTSRLFALATALLLGPLILYGLFHGMLTLSPPPPEVPGNDAIRPALPRFAVSLAIATAWTLAIHEMLRVVLASLRRFRVERRA
jgi:hypothetical protein